jgi:hypothetical protein
MNKTLKRNRRTTRFRHQRELQKAGLSEAKRLYLRSLREVNTSRRKTSQTVFITKTGRAVRLIVERRMRPPQEARSPAGPDSFVIHANQLDVRGNRNAAMDLLWASDVAPIGTEVIVY